MNQEKFDKTLLILPGLILFGATLIYLAITGAVRDRRECDSKGGILLHLGPCVKVEVLK